MAIIFCPECGTQISEHAMQCTKCSYPISKLKTQFNNQPNFTQTNFTQSSAIGNQARETANGLILAGYICSILSLFLFSIVLAIAGIVIGVITISKGQTGHGIAHIILSIIFGVIGGILGILTLFLY